MKEKIMTYIRENQEAMLNDLMVLCGNGRF